MYKLLHCRSNRYDWITPWAELRLFIKYRIVILADALQVKIETKSSLGLNLRLGEIVLSHCRP